MILAVYVLMYVTVFVYSIVAPKLMPDSMSLGAVKVQCNGHQSRYNNYLCTKYVSGALFCDQNETLNDVSIDTTGM